jgi:steroid 5-alpha reductase family enzyme
MNIFLSTLILALFIQVIFFLFAAYFKTDKVTDLSYGLTFIILGIFTLSCNKNPSFVQIILLLMVIAWGTRLSLYLFQRIIKTKKDKRFDGVRENPIKFARFWLLQALSVWIISLPTTYLLSLKFTNGWNPILSIALFVWLTGLVIETLADLQKYFFKNNPQNQGLWISHGLWKYSRHPNYFGEILCWWGIFIYSLPYQSDLSWLTVTGPVFITFLLLFVSGLPPLEKKYDKIYQNNLSYQKYKKSTSLLFPLPPRKNTPFIATQT